jgi:membrane protein required for colicin V production
MNALDLAIIAVIALSAVFAFARGFVREALSIVAWVGAAAITLYGYRYADSIILRFITTPLLAELIAGAGLFLVSVIVLTIATGSIARRVEKSALSQIDRTLGLMFGLARGVVLVILAYLALDVMLPLNDRPAIIKEAKSERFLAKGANMLRDALPQSLQIKSAGLSDDAHRMLDQAEEAKRARGALASPAAPSPTSSGQPVPPSYKSGERRGMEQLIETLSPQQSGR